MLTFPCTLFGGAGGGGGSPQTGDVASSDDGSDKVYFNQGKSSTIRDSYSAPDGLIRACTYDGTDMILGGLTKIYVMTGFTSTISTSFANASSQTDGLTLDGSLNLISADSAVGKIFLHSGISGTISSSFVLSGRVGLAFDGTNLLSCTVTKIFVHSGITSTITTSFSSPSTLCEDLACDGSNIISIDRNSHKVYIHSGKTSTISSSYAAPASSPRGLTFIT